MNKFIHQSEDAEKNHLEKRFSRTTMVAMTFAILKFATPFILLNIFYINEDTAPG
jgi:hypothetical protein